jgi:ubiquitin C-terminal hydrolase
MRLRECLLEELQPSLDVSNVTKHGLMYDEHLHSSMQSFGDLFSTGIVYMQKIKCTICNRTFIKKEPFSELMLHFPQLHHESDHACTLKELISHHNAPEDIHDYQCITCNMRTCASKHSIISQYPKILCIVLSHKKSNETKIKSAVQYPLCGLFGSVHHKANRGKSGHYIAICEHRGSNDWFSYDDADVRCVQFVNKRNGKVLTEFMKTAAILFYVNYTAVPVHSNNLREHNKNDETQGDIDADEDASSSSSTVSSSSSKQGQNKSTNETAQAASIYMHTQNDSSNDPAPPKP